MLFAFAPGKADNTFDMEKAKLTVSAVARKAVFPVVLWIFTGWLLYPLIVLDSVSMLNAKAYLYRSAMGICIMIIILGKSIFDLLFPQEISQKKSWAYTIILTFYSLVITGGVIFMVSRMIVLFVKQNQSSGGSIF
jgi:hypothetical protein